MFQKCEMNNPEFTVIAVVTAARGTQTFFIITLVSVVTHGPLFLVRFFNTKMGNDIHRFLKLGT